MHKLSVLDDKLITKNLLKILAQNNIITVFEFVQQDADRLSTITKLNLSHILEIKNKIYEKYSAPLLEGAFLFSKSLTKKRYIDTGIERLNVVLGGGIPIGYITELCGLAGSGKTQLSFQLAANCARKTDNTILYIDCKGDFSAIRIQKILTFLGCSNQEVARALSKIKIIRIWSMEEMVTLLKNLKNKTCQIEHLAMIIIDSLPCLMFQHFGDDNNIGLTFLNIFVNNCRFLCKNYEIAIICINLQTRWVEQDVSDGEDGENQVGELSYTEKRNRCLGKYWQNIPALVVLLEKIQLNELPDKNKNSASVKITLIRSNGLKLGQNCLINVDSSGVR